ncbi:MAG: M1 family aminopeptidase [Myxococcales bacterium]|nr:M1 family aminopeptidase [Myxococcales bacterium]
MSRLDGMQAAPRTSRVRAVAHIVLAVLPACGGPSVTTPTTASPPARPEQTPSRRASAPSLEPPPADLRLPADTVPSRYALELRIDTAAERIEGVVEIALRVHGPRRAIWLHARELDVRHVVVVDSHGRPVGARWRLAVPDEGLGAIDLDSPLQGDLTVALRWAGPLRRALDGAYLVEVDGRRYVFTQFQPLSARRAFPSLDEPRFKTPFDVTLVVRDGELAFANASQAAREPEGNGWTRFRFRTTPPLPTYLVAWAVGPFDVVEAPPVPAPPGIERPPLPLRGLAVRGRGGSLGHALAHTPQLLAVLETWFGSPYPYDKLDIVAVPDFEAGAMENAGLITFRDGLLLLEPDAPVSQRRAFALVMAHELAHQWFGNLVTMAWWDDLWLNEGFASWLELVAVARWQPSMRAEQIALQWVHDTMRTDALPSARRVRQPIASSHDIHAAFDDITYGKGLALLAMYDHALGADTMQRAVRRYLEAHRWRVADTDDFLRAVDQAAGIDVSTSWRTFLDQPGLPQVHAQLVCEDRAGPAVRLAQRRFRSVGTDIDPNGTRWRLPVCMRWHQAGQMHAQCAWLTESEAIVPLDSRNPRCPDWLLPNASGSGYYRFALAEGALHALLAHGWPALSATERMAVVDSVLASIEAHPEQSRAVLETLPRFAADTERSVALAPAELLEWLDGHVVSDDDRPAFSTWVRSLYADRARRLGLDARPEEDEERTLTRAAVVRVMARLGRDPSLRRELADRARRWADELTCGTGPPSISTDLLETALCVWVETEGTAAVTRLAEQLGASNPPAVRRSILGALGCAADPEAASIARRLSLDGPLRQNEILRVPVAQLRSAATREQAWQFVREQWDALAGRATRESMVALAHASAALCDTARLPEIERDLGARVRSLPGGPPALAQAFDDLRRCHALVMAVAPRLRDHLRERAGPGAARARTASPR